MHKRQHLGALGEGAAVAYLEGLGYVVIDRNWHAGRYGEIDIVALDGPTLVFTEVKTRSSTGFGMPEEAVTRAKQAKLKGAIQAYQLAHPQLPQQARCDVIAVLANDGEVQDLKHYLGVGITQGYN